MTYFNFFLYLHTYNIEAYNDFNKYRYQGDKTPSNKNIRVDEDIKSGFEEHEDQDPEFERLANNGEYNHDSDDNHGQEYEDTLDLEDDNESETNNVKVAAKSKLTNKGKSIMSSSSRPSNQQQSNKKQRIVVTNK